MNLSPQNLDYFAVRVEGERVVIAIGDDGKDDELVLSRKHALYLAAWIVAKADPIGLEFCDLVNAIPKL